MNQVWSLLRKTIPILFISAMVASVISVVPVMAANPATQLVFTTQPSNSNTAGSPFSGQPVVTVEDQFGNTVSSNASITLSLTGAGPSNAALAGTVTIDAVGGVATFSGLSINLAGTGYTLTASTNGLPSVASDPLSVEAGTASQLVFSSQPSTSNTAGEAFSGQPVVTVEDQYGNTVTTSNASVTISLSGTVPKGAGLSGTVTQTASNGVATFSGLNINLTGTGYTLTAASSGLTSATSNTLTVLASTATKLVFTSQPSANNNVGSTFSGQPVVTVEDQYGNTVTTSSANVALTLTGTVPSGAQLSGNASVSVNGGVATFSGLSINEAGTGYTLTAASSGLTPAISNVFVVVGEAFQLAFTTQPSASNTAGIAFGKQPIVNVEDSLGSTVTNSTASITLSLSGTVPTGASLAGTVTVNAVNGVAQFTGLSINLAGTAYALAANSTGLSPATSNSFSVVG